MSTDLQNRRHLPSYFPGYGAIFLSNQSTKEECLQRKLFGLPHFFSDFIFEVKVGMLLFLYDYQERKLYGVFEATSNGGLDLVPGAYKSAKKSFPAQVRFKVLWQCAPLDENDFRHAIAENYYTANKFNLGLSRDQVGSLLFLFEKTKLKIQRSFMSDGCHERNIKNMSSSGPQNRDAVDVDELIDDSIWNQAHGHDGYQKNFSSSTRGRGWYSNNRYSRLSALQRLGSWPKVIEEKRDSSAENTEDVLYTLDKKCSIWQNECTTIPSPYHEDINAEIEPEEIVSGTTIMSLKRKNGFKVKAFKDGKRKKTVAGQYQKRKCFQETKTCNKHSLVPDLSDHSCYDPPCETETSMTVAGDANVTQEAPLTDSFDCEDAVGVKLGSQIHLEASNPDDPVEMLLAEFKAYLSRYRIEDQNERVSMGVDSNVDTENCSVRVGENA